jgi:hypothetical protein
MMSNENHQPGISRVLHADINKFVKSKDDLYAILAIEGQLHLPPFDDCTLEFLRDILAGRKKAMSNSQINMVNVPRLKEFNVSALTARAMSDSLCQQYLPDPAGSKARPVNRNFLFNVSHHPPDSYWRHRSSIPCAPSTSSTRSRPP